MQFWNSNKSALHFWKSFLRSKVF